MVEFVLFLETIDKFCWYNHIHMTCMVKCYLLNKVLGIPFLSKHCSSLVDRIQQVRILAHDRKSMLFRTSLLKYTLKISLSHAIGLKTMLTNMTFNKICIECYTSKTNFFEVVYLIWGGNDILSTFVGV